MAGPRRHHQAGPPLAGRLSFPTAAALKIPGKMGIMQHMNAPIVREEKKGWRAMKLLLDQQAVEQVLEPLRLEYTRVGWAPLPGYRCQHQEDATFFFTKDPERVETFLVAELTEEAVWQLDQFLTPILFYKTFHTFPQGEVCLYRRRWEQACSAYQPRVETIRELREKQLQLPQCDLYLLIPGKFRKDSTLWESLKNDDDSVYSQISASMDKCIREEYNPEFGQKLERKSIANVQLEIQDWTDHQQYIQGAVLGIVKHETGICILEIMVPNCSIGGNKLLNYYCGGFFTLRIEGETYTLPQLMEKLQIRSYGRKRSMAFAYGPVTDTEIINALANEEFPMGKIGGDFRDKLLQENIAQYDTAQVYVSHETMVEKCSSLENRFDRRMAYQGIEIFFVELILFQDAAVDKVYKDLLRESEQQRGYRDSDQAYNQYEQLSFDMEKALKFCDFEQFKFPTVRKSAQKVSRHFGLEDIVQKYDQNKELLASMIAANKRRAQQKQERVKNRFLFLISALALVGTLGEILYAVHNDGWPAVASYGMAVTIILVLYFFYLALERLSQKQQRQELEKGIRK